MAFVTLSRPILNIRAQDPISLRVACSLDLAAARNTQHSINTLSLDSIMKRSKKPLPIPPYSHGKSIFDHIPSVTAKKANAAVHGVDRVNQHASPSSADIVLQQSPIQQATRFPLFKKASKPHSEWRPFMSSLIDTVALVINVRHEPLNELAENNSWVRQKGNFELQVLSTVSKKIKARVMSREKRSKLYIEASVPKYLTGQNIVGREELLDQCIALIDDVLPKLGLVPTPTERAAINAGIFKMVRIDFAMHCDCGTPDRAVALMTALRSLVFAKAKDASAYGVETVYVNQHSSYWTLRCYRKDLEILKSSRALPLNVYGRDYLMGKVQNCVRLELVLRARELTRLGLNVPAAWTVDGAHKRMQKWINRLSDVEGVCPSVDRIKELPAGMQTKLLGWLAGDLATFARSPSTENGAYKKILAVTGINIHGEPSVERQRSATLCIRDVFQQGIGFKDHGQKWDRLLKGAEPAVSTANRPNSKAGDAASSQRSAQL